MSGSGTEMAEGTAQPHMADGDDISEASAPPHGVVSEETVQATVQPHVVDDEEMVEVAALAVPQVEDQLTAQEAAQFLLPGEELEEEQTNSDDLLRDMEYLLRSAGQDKQANAVAAQRRELMPMDHFMLPPLPNEEREVPIEDSAQEEIAQAAASQSTTTDKPAGELEEEVSEAAHAAELNELLQRNESRYDKFSAKVEQENEDDNIVVAFLKILF